MKKGLWMVLLGGIWLSMNVMADTITKVIPLHYVSSEKILPLVQPLAKDNETITGEGQNIVVSVSPMTLTKVRMIIQQIDVPPQLFIVSIHQGDDSWLEGQGTDVETYGTVSKANQSNDQSVEVMSGESAYVSTGQNVPVISGVSAGWWTGVDYEREKLTQGFWVMPQMKGNKIMLKIKRLREGAQVTDLQSLESQAFETTTFVPPNQWVKIAVSGQTNVQPDEVADTYQAGNGFNNANSLYIKVEMKRM